MSSNDATNSAQLAAATRIRAERDKRGWTQMELGERAGLSEFQVNRIEKGTKRLSAGEVTALAGALGLPLAELLTPVKRRGMAWAARLQEGSDGHAALTATRALVELVELEDQLSALGAIARVEPLRVTVSKSGPYLRQAAHAASAVRVAAGIEPDAAIEDLEGLLESYGIDVLVSVLDAGVSGLCAVEDSTEPDALRLAAIDSSDSWGRQRYTMAHELGHVIFGDPHPDVPLVDRYSWGPDKPFAESRADAFAGELLAPEAALMRVKALFEASHGSFQGRLQDTGSTGKLAVLACEQLGLSVESMSWRLFNTELISLDMRNWLSNQGKGELFEDCGAGDVWAQWQQAQFRVVPPRRILAGALAAYSQGTLGVSPLARLYGRPDTEAVRAELHDAGWAPTPSSTRALAMAPE